MTEKKKPGSKNARNKASAKKPARKKSGTTQKPVNSAVLKEAVGILLVTTGVLLLVCRLFNVDMGTFGASVNNFLGSLAGRGAIVIPFSVTVVGVLIFLDRYWGIKSMRFISLILFSLIIPAFAHMSVVFSDDLTIYLTDAAAGGGQIGGRVSFALRKAFGDIGTVLILVSLSLVGLVLFTGRSLRVWIQAAGARIRPSFESLHPNMTEEEYLQKKEEEIIRRNELSKQKYQKRLDNKIERRLENQLDNRHAENGHTETAQATDTSLPIIIRHDDSIAIAPMDIKTPRRRIRAEDVSFVRDFMLSVDKDTGNQENSIKSEAACAAGVDDIQDISDLEQDSQNDNVSLTELIEYILPEPELMTAAVTVKNPNANKVIANTVSVLEETLESFGIKAKVTQVVAGPAITRYELQPAPGIKVSRIVSLSDDIAMSLAASDVRIEAPIPGKSAIGIEVPREETSTVFFREVIESPEFKNSPSKLTFGLGKDIAGKVIVGDLAKMPHLLVAGATGMGKSVCINSLICSILYKAKPSEVKFLFIDPKKVELSNYAGLPHLNSPVVTDAKKAAPTLKGVVNEMENRYDLFSSAGVRDFPGYNTLNPESPLYHIVVIIDELADLMMLARDEIENNICRLTQMARAAGIHIVIATQRPSVDVITGLIKANVPSRIAFAVTSSTDSRTVLDMGGAEKLIGKGDMLYYPVGISKPIRVQGTYISEFDTQTLVDYCKAQASPNYNQAISDIQASADNPSLNSDMDSLFVEVVREVLRSGQASASYLQRRFKLGNPRAARIMDSLEENGIVGPSEGAKPRKILISAEEFERRFGLKQGNKDETERNG